MQKPSSFNKNVLFAFLHCTCTYKLLQYGGHIYIIHIQIRVVLRINEWWGRSHKYWLRTMARKETYRMEHCQNKYVNTHINFIFQSTLRVRKYFQLFPTHKHERWVSEKVVAPTSPTKAASARVVALLARRLLCRKIRQTRGKVSRRSSL